MIKKWCDVCEQPISHYEPTYNILIRDPKGNPIYKAPDVCKNCATSVSAVLANIKKVNEQK